MIKRNNIKILCVILFVITCLLTACQPTPEKEIVIPKDNTEKKVIEAAKSEQENAEEIIEEPVFKYQMPEHVSERFSVVEGKLDILIDADVFMPEIDSVPVAKIKCSPFTQERADELREYFMRDGKLVTSYVRTKEDYDAMIIEAKRGHEVDGEFVFDESSQNWVDQLIAEREKAPEDDVSNLITDYSINGKEGFDGRLIINGEEKGNLFGNEEYFGYSGTNPFRVDDNNQYDDNGNLIEYPTVKINMTEEEAIQAAQSFLEELGITGMAVKEMYKAYYYSSYSGYDPRSEPEFGGYYIMLMREFGGMMPINIESYGMGQEDKFEVSPPVKAETMRIAIDENGNILTFSWSKPIEIVEVLTEHVEILSFEDIMKRLREFSKIQWAYAYIVGYGGDVMMLKKIYKIDFSLIYLPIKNNNSEFMYAPCWAFAYRSLAEHTQEDIERLEENGITPPHEEEMGTQYIIFSAVDGASVSAYTSEEYEKAKQRWGEYERN